ncbi:MULTISPECIES: hypothetical protein [Legionella]|uniref:Uncharacterized protein n=1 Tax=Legionella maceachernii TaxID=466 RepID=A0A0W0WGK4_9GAMM|nr:hypothetical protein [Legionella maceachernii]KTD31463.1 hypothetical protein Lmac_0211 [Legionella maceachernii]SJZ93998.1 hypothetical protein SAMN02745128_01520 [Legionella maceachernii]SUP03405.1 Uncharacterised protein [Legionella maceachernii]
MIVSTYCLIQGILSCTADDSVDLDMRIDVFTLSDTVSERRHNKGKGLALC